MKFRSFQIKGKGRGKELGFPTINLNIPDDFSLEEGIYGAWIWIGEKKYLGAMHYGSVPTFKQTEKSLEIYIIDSFFTTKDMLLQKNIDIKVIKKVRDIYKFSSLEDLADQIQNDIGLIKKISQA